MEKMTEKQKSFLFSMISYFLFFQLLCIIKLQRIEKCKEKDVIITC